MNSDKINQVFDGMGGCPSSKLGQASIITCINFYRRLAVMKWNGWGYKDSGFMLDDKHVAKFIGKR